MAKSAARPIFGGLLAALLLALAAVAQAADVGGVAFAETEPLAGTRLTLNGAGMRAVLVLRAYAIGLYLPQRKSTSAEVLALPGPKRLRIVPLTALTAAQFARALEGGIEKNHSEGERQPLKTRLEDLQAAILAMKSAPKGTLITLDWQPRTGTRLSVNGKKQGQDIPGEDFYRALLKIWLGDKPTQPDLKAALLGRAA